MKHISKATKRHWLAARLLAALVAVFVAGSALAATINVNLANVGTPANTLNGRAYSTGGYNQAPVSYTGTAWNEYAVTPTTGIALLDSGGTATAVGFTTTSSDGAAAMQGPSNWADHSNVPLLQAGVYRANNSGSGNSMRNRFTITGLTPGGLYHVTLVGCRNDTAAGEWGIGTASAGPAAGTTKTIINSGTITESWVAGQNYAILYRVAADANGKIFVWGKGQPGTGGYANGLTLNGFQVSDAADFPSPECDLLSMTVPGGAGVISGTDVTLYVPTGTDVTALVPTITVSSGATVSPASGVANDFTNPQTYTVTAEDLTTTKAYTVTVVHLDPTGKIYVNADNSARTGQEGPAGDIGATWNERVGQTAASSTSGLVDSVGFPTSVGYTTTGYDGLDQWSNPSLVVLVAGLRQFDTSANNAQSLTINGLTADANYNVWICSANCEPTQKHSGYFSTPNANPLGTATHTNFNISPNVLNGSTWEEGNNYVKFVKVTASGTGTITINGKATTSYRLPLSGFQIEPYVASTACDILTFGIPGYAGVIDQNAKTITLDVPAGTSLATLAPTFTTSLLATCNQTSGAAPTPNFSAGPVHYIVTADDGVTQKDYTVTVNVMTLSTACDMLTFGIPGSTGVIDQGAQTIALTVPYGTSLATLAPTYTTSPLATCNQPNSGVPTPNFGGGPVHYIVTAQDGVTQKDYTATVTVAPYPPGGVVAGLRVWLNAGAVNPADLTQVDGSGNVLLWPDSSGYGNNATNTTDYPVYVADGLSTKPVVRFAATSDDGGPELKLGDLSAQFPTAGSMFAVATIGTPDNTTDGRYNLFDNSNNDSRWVADSWTESQPGVFRGGRTGNAGAYASWPQTGSHVFAMESSSSVYRFVMDGTQIGVTGGDYNSGAGQNWTIGDRPSNGQQLNGDIAELILYDRVLSPEEANAVGAYLAAKYGLATEYSGPAQIRTFGIPGNAGIINQAAKTIALTVPPCTDVTALAPTFTLSSGTCDKASGSTQDFTNPVTYTVTDGTTVNPYVVTVTMVAPDAENVFNLGAQDAGTTLQVVSFPDNMGNLVPWITKGTLPAGSILKSISINSRLDSSTADSWTSDLLVYLDGAPEAAGTAALLQVGGDYSGPVGTVAQLVGWNGGDGGPGTVLTDTKTAGVDWAGDIDLHDVQLSLGNNYAPSSWSGTVTVTYLSSVKEMLTFTFPAYGAATISGTSITMSVPLGTDLTKMSPTYTICGDSCTPASGSEQNFTGPVIYTVKGSDGSTKDYTVTVTIPPWINVNFDNTPQTGLVGPADGLGVTWNQISATSGSALLDYAGAATSAGFTSSGMTILGPWGNPTLKMLRNGLANFDSSSANSQQVVINGLPSTRKFDVYIASANCINPATSNQRSYGVWKTPNTTTTPGDHVCDNRANQIGDTWVEGNNYVLISNVVPDSSGNITLDGYSIPDAPTYDVRLPLSGFQLVDKGAATIVPEQPVITGSDVTYPVGGKPTVHVGTTQVGVTYTLVYKNELTDADWSPLGGTGSLPGTGGAIDLIDPTDPAPAHRFYRVMAQ